MCMFVIPTYIYSILYIYFVYPGNPERFTNPAVENNSPLYNESFSFPIVTDDSVLRLLQRTRLLVMIVDMNSNNDTTSTNITNSNNKYRSSSSAPGLIGETSIALTSLTEGVDINNETYKLTSTDYDHPVGNLSVSIQWKHKFRKRRELGMRALSSVDVEHLISAFIADDPAGEEIGRALNRSRNSIYERNILLL